MLFHIDPHQNKKKKVKFQYKTSPIDFRAGPKAASAYFISSFS